MKDNGGKMTEQNSNPDTQRTTSSADEPVAAVVDLPVTDEQAEGTKGGGFYRLLGDSNGDR